MTSSDQETKPEIDSNPGSKSNKLSKSTIAVIVISCIFVIVVIAFVVIIVLLLKNRIGSKRPAADIENEMSFTEN